MNQTISGDRGTRYPGTCHHRARDLFAFRRHEAAATGESPRAKARRRFEKVSKKANAKTEGLKE